MCAGDFDNDGHTDLLITHWGKNVLYRNQGDSTFLDETKARGLESPRPRWSTGCAFLDYDRDGHLDLFVANYLEFDLNTAPRPRRHRPLCLEGAARLLWPPRPAG